MNPRVPLLPKPRYTWNAKLGVWWLRYISSKEYYGSDLRAMTYAWYELPPIVCFPYPLRCYSYVYEYTPSLRRYRTTDGPQTNAQAHTATYEAQSQCQAH